MSEKTLEQKTEDFAKWIKTQNHLPHNISIYLFVFHNETISNFSIVNRI